MKSKTPLVIIFIICFGLQSGWCQTHINKTIETKQKCMEEYLHTANIVSIEKNTNESGRTDWWRITLNDGKNEKKAVFKWINRSRPTLLPDSYHYEIAAYELNKLLLLDIIPPVVEREIEGAKGSLQPYIEGCFPLSQLKRKGIEPPIPKDFQDALQELAVFENLTYCERNDPGDILIQEKEWKIYRVDFSEAFAPEKSLPGPEFTRCSSQLYQRLQKLDIDEVKSKLSPYLNDEEIEALMERKNIILKKLETLMKEKGENRSPALELTTYINFNILLSNMKYPSIAVLQSWSLKMYSRI